LNIAFFPQKIWLLIGCAAVLSACSTGPQITRIQDVPKSADTPYENILVISLLEVFESRKRLERAVVDRLADLGVEAVASTSLMKTTTPMSRKTYLAMVDKLNPDALLITQLIDSDSKVAMTESASPEATYNVRPTYYFNVWEVELTEYMEPETIGFEASFVLTTELYSVASRERIWAIESKSRIAGTGTLAENYMVFLDEGKAIVDFMLKDGLIDR
jgi:hypothetical protein